MGHERTNHDATKILIACCPPVLLVVGSLLSAGIFRLCRVNGEPTVGEAIELFVGTVILFGPPAVFSGILAAVYLPARDWRIFATMACPALIFPAMCGGLEFNGTFERGTDRRDRIQVAKDTIGGTLAGLSCGLVSASGAGLIAFVVIRQHERFLFLHKANRFEPGQESRLPGGDESTHIKVDR